MRIPGFLDKWMGRASGVWTFAGPVVPGTAAAIVTGALSSGVSWINQFGAFGWWCSALVGFIIFSSGAVLLGWSREMFANANARRKWASTVESVNPLDDHFNRKTIGITDLAHPIKKTVERKSFTNCRLVGPGAIYIKDGVLNGVAFGVCDFVVLKDNAVIQNVTVFDSCNFAGGEIVLATVYVNKIMANDMGGMNPNFVTEVP